MLPRLSLLTIAILNASTALGAINLLNSDTDYPTRATGQFLTGESQLGGFADAMLPFMQNKDHIVFADGTFMAGQGSRYTYSGGLGYRGIMDTKLSRGIFGVYGFVENYQTGGNSDFWQLNPGLEWLNERYEARLQGYIPVSERRHTYANTFASLIPATVLKDSGQSTAGLNFVTGHSLFDTPVALQEEAGPGVELEVGRFLNVGKGMWLRGGGYYFNYQNANSIQGGQANIEMVLNHNASLLIQDNYDNQNKNMFSVGVRLNLGGSPAPIGTLEQRMTSPIIRHTARQSFGEALPTRETFAATGPTSLVANNIAFFSPTGVNPIGVGFAPDPLEYCTAEHPCQVITDNLATQLEAVLPDTKLFFASGTYDLQPNAFYSGSTLVRLQDGQSVWGRTTGWLHAANGLERPLINGGIYWTAANAVGAVNDMRVFNNNQNESANALYGLYAEGNLTVTNSDVVADSILGLALTAYSVRSRATINVINSTITLNAAHNGGSFQTIAVRGTNQANVINSRIEVNSTFQGGGSTLSYAVNSDNVTRVSNSDVTATMNAGSGAGSNNGVVATNNLTISNSKIKTTATGNSTLNQRGADAISGTIAADTIEVDARATAVGALTNYGVAAQNNLSIANSTIKTTATGNASVFDIGVLSFSGAIAADTIEVDARGTAVGALTNNGVAALNNISIANSKINTTATGNASVSQVGVYSQAGTIAADTIEVDARATAGGTLENYGVSAQTNLSIANSTIKTTATGNASVTQVGVVSFSGAIAADTIEVDARATAVGALINNGVAAQNNLSLLNSKINVLAVGQGALIQYGVRSFNGNTTIANSFIAADGTGAGLLTNSAAFGDDNIDVTNSILQAYATGTSIASVNNMGVWTNGTATVRGSQITTQTSGATVTGVGVFGAGNVTLSNNSITTIANSSTGNVTAYGAQSTLANVIFNGTTPSYLSVTAGSTSGVVTADGVQAGGTVMNNDGSVCSVNGVTGVCS